MLGEKRKNGLGLIHKSALMRVLFFFVQEFLKQIFFGIETDCRLLRVEVAFLFFYAVYACLYELNLAIYEVQ